MNKIKIFTFLLLALTLGSLSGDVMANTTHIEKINHVMPVDQCTNPTEFRAISTVEEGLKYNESVMKVPKNTCVQITFVNLQVMPHDFVVDEDLDNNFGAIHIHVMNNTAGMNGSNFLTQNVLTPNVGITYTFYCSMPGHSTSMVGDFVVGEGSSSNSAPGFEFIGLFLSFVTIFTIIKIRKRD